MKRILQLMIAPAALSMTVMADEINIDVLNLSNSTINVEEDSCTYELSSSLGLNHSFKSLKVTQNVPSKLGMLCSAELTLNDGKVIALKDQILFSPHGKEVPTQLAINSAHKVVLFKNDSVYDRYPSCDCDEYQISDLNFFKLLDPHFSSIEKKAKDDLGFIKLAFSDKKSKFNVVPNELEANMLNAYSGLDFDAHNLYQYDLLKTSIFDSRTDTLGLVTTTDPETKKQSVNLIRLWIPVGFSPTQSDAGDIFCQNIRLDAFAWQTLTNKVPGALTNNEKDNAEKFLARNRGVLINVLSSNQ